MNTLIVGALNQVLVYSLYAADKYAFEIIGTIRFRHFLGGNCVLALWGVD
jgi:hypothetical protein